MAALKSLLLRLKHDENTVGLNASKITVAIRSGSLADVLVSSPAISFRLEAPLMNTILALFPLYLEN